LYQDLNKQNEIDMKLKQIILTATMSAMSIFTVCGQNAEADKHEQNRVDSLDRQKKEMASEQKAIDEIKMDNVKDARNDTKKIAKEAQRVEREASDASKQSKNALRAEKKAQKSRKQADKQAQIAEDARTKSNRN
jgi:hypothetical protein